QAGPGRGALLRLDRRRPPEPRRGQLHPALQPPEDRQLLERRQHQALRRAREGRPRASARTRSLRAPLAQDQGPLLVRGPAEGPRSLLYEEAARARAGVAVLRAPAPGVPPPDGLLGDGREAARDAGAAARDPDRALGPGAEDPAPGRRERPENLSGTK